MHFFFQWAWHNAWYLRHDCRLCAAPGSKTLQILDLMQPQAERVVVQVDCVTNQSVFSRCINMHQPSEAVYQQDFLRSFPWLQIVEVTGLLVANDSKASRLRWNRVGMWQIETDFEWLPSEFSVWKFTRKWLATWITSFEETCWPGSTYSNSTTSGDPGRCKAWHWFGKLWYPAV